MSHSQQPWTRDRDMASRPKPSPASRPRRRPAHESVSLIKGPISKHHPKPTSTGLGGPPFSQSPPRKNKESSGESSNASRWFEKSNNDTSQPMNSFVDNDSPFFLRTSSSSESPPERQTATKTDSNSHLRPASAPWPVEQRRPLMYHSNSDDFRSVIDDLTIKNKKLKRKLKRYEKLHDAHLQDEKLFEVRVHGLPAEKKRELEETLRKFTLGLEPSQENASFATSYDLNVPALDNRKTASSLSSTKCADSAYASASASGQNSTVPSKNDGHRRKIPSAARTAQANANIQSYLHDIPAGLLPRQRIAMTDKAKKKLVVRRLEQIFAGKLPTTEGHLHPMQQEEVARSAAQDDKDAIEATGQTAPKEGLREAQMLIRELEASNDSSENLNEKENAQYLQLPDQHPFGPEPSPHQRPTRPLDLDPDRAQVPAENIEYIRHLGFSPLDADSTEPQSDKHGWIYLNVLTNMAQLHTINVTSDFVKTAILSYSDKLELSPDERKVRWKGGTIPTRHSSYASPDERASEHSNGNDSVAKGRKRIKLGLCSTTASDTASKSKSRDKFAYTPLFFRRDSESDGYESGPEQISSSTSPWPAQLGGDSSGFASSGTLNSLSRKWKDDGPIIFYSKAPFCTDLSGERNFDPEKASSQTRYSCVTAQPVGAAVERPSDPHPRGRNGGFQIPLARIPELGEPMDIDQGTTSSDESIKFSPYSTSLSRENSHEDKNANFEVSGLGGIYPEDNFVIDVQCRQRRIDGDHQGKPNVVKGYTPKIQQVLHREDSALPIDAKDRRSTVVQEILSTRHRNLPASTLPPPACAFLPYDSDADSDSDESCDSGVSSHISLTSSTGREVAPQPLHFASESSGSETDDEEDGSESFDLLASAYEVDPETIHARESEYDANMADRLAEEIPAGSSAATAGGGSGFNSPESLRDVVGEDKARPRSRKRSWHVDVPTVREIPAEK